ncbi:MAG: biotin/lipoyl-binding protein [Oscillospiraceae bacterium]|nr:biotin/lipoyl-binding protein [Oscillospiraceae bacterium]
MKEFLITVNGKTYEVQVEETGEKPSVNPIPVPKSAPKVAPMPNPATPKPEVKPVSSGAAGKTVIKSPMPGVIVKVNVNTGDTVKSGTVLCVLEAMKMENEIMASENGVVVSVNTSKGANVNTGDILLTIN